MTNTIEIITYNWLGENLRKVEIPAVIRGGFAIHRPYRGELIQSEWAITHIKSGLACCYRKNLVDAKKTVKAFESLSVNGVAFRDMPACEALALMPVLIEKWAGINEKELTSEKIQEHIDHAAEVADILACARNPQ